MRILYLGRPTILNQSVERVLSENGFDVHMRTLRDFKEKSAEHSGPAFDIALIDVDALPNPKEEQIQSLRELKLSDTYIAVHNGYPDQFLQPILDAGCSNHISFDTPTEEWVQQIKLYG